MIRDLAMLALIGLAACTDDPAPENAKTDAADLAKYDGWIQDIRAKETVRRSIQNELLPESVRLETSAARAGTLAIEVGPGERHQLVADAAVSNSVESFQRYKICNSATLVVPVQLDIFPLPGIGPEHPGVQHVEIAPGACLFARGQKIEAWRADDGTQEQQAEEANKRKADEWLKARIVQLETELSAETDPRKRSAAEVLLNEFKSRQEVGYKIILPPRRLIVTPVPG